MDTTELLFLKLDSLKTLIATKLQSNSNSMSIELWWKYILLAGLFGALAGYVYKLSNDSNWWQPKEAMKSLILGIAAAFMGPVILFVLRSDILKVIKESDEGVYYLIGISVLVSMFGQYFIEKLKSIFDTIKQQELKIDALEKAMFSNSMKKPIFLNKIKNEFIAKKQNTVNHYNFNTSSCTDFKVGTYFAVEFENMRNNGAHTFVQVDAICTEHNECTRIFLGVKADGTTMNNPTDLVASPCPPCCEGGIQDPNGV
ncbi:MAG: hypothetical protein HOP11_14425 [Saprospiraceae bacterium]|nr:hypothetical protein [Saprospiraceae bacterium]